MTRFLAITVGLVTVGAAAGASTGTDKNENGLRGTPSGRKLHYHDEPAFCNSIGCPAGFQPIPDAMNVECDGDVCSVEQCCQTFCSSFPCPGGYIPTDNAGTVLCNDQDCTKEQCCDLVDQGGHHRNRKLHYHEELALCNSIGCPAGFQPIPDAMNVECYGDVCSVEQCCQTFCSSFPCPGGYISTDNAGTVLCNDQDCTKEQCCDLVDQGGHHRNRKLHYHEEPAFCNSIGCPAGFQPIPDAMNVECYGDVCSVEQCCQTFCSSFPCPGGYIPIDHAGTVLCNDQDCTKEQCCDLVDQGGHHRNRKLHYHEEPAFCNSIGCPAGFQPIPDAMNVECCGDVCSVEQCCQTFCSSFPCPGGYIPIDHARTVLCNDQDCTKEQCCDLVDQGGHHRNRKLHDHEESALCNSIGCPAGFQPIPDAMNVECYGDVCSVEQCCQTFCSSFPCPGGYIPIDNAGSVLCNDQDCTKEQCCDLVDQGGHHRNRKLHYHEEPALCNSIGCPAGFQPIPDAMNVECDGDVCSVEQCCQTFSSSFPCPSGWIPVENADTVLCTDQDCTNDKCCEHVHH